MAFLKLTSISKAGDDFSLENISFSQRKLENIAIAGETGAGKSTLLKIIAGLVQPDSGVALFENRKIIGPQDTLVPGHPGVAYLSQQFDLQKSLRVEQVLSYSNTLSGRESERLFNVCQIDHLLTRRTDQLSGGEKQRIAICRLLISSPRLLLLDEPFSHLDPGHKNTLKDVIRDIGDKLKITCVLVSHDPADTLSWAHKILVLKGGRLQQSGTPESIYSRPVSEYTAGLFGKYNLIHRGNFRPFAVIAGMKKLMDRTAGKGVFIRPENFRLTNRRTSAARGKVQKIRYFGNHRELDVTLGKSTVTVTTHEMEIREQQTVYLTVSMEHVWTIPE